MLRVLDRPEMRFTAWAEKQLELERLQSSAEVEANRLREVRQGWTTHAHALLTTLNENLGTR